ncbi:MAG: universal stress protein [Acidobacteriota bacterium]|nr:universal stress protein [Acidobacteriota bacterium]
MKILLAIDDSRFSKAALQSVLTLAPPKGTHVRVLHVIEPPSVLVARGLGGYNANLRMVWEAQRKNGQALVEQFAKDLAAGGFKVTTSIVQGEARSKIVDVARKWHADLIVVGSHGRRGLERFLMGSVSGAVVHHAPCSVQVVRPGSKR